MTLIEQPSRPARSRRAGGHANRPARHDILDGLPEQAERGLRRYTAQVAAAIGTGPEATWCEWADAPGAYIALDARLPDYPDRDAALTWAAECGWTVAVETGCGEDLLVIASLDGDVLPAPETVATFARAVIAGRRANADRRPGTAGRAGLARRLAGWAQPRAIAAHPRCRPSPGSRAVAR